jgi:hypothetical protein
VGPRRSAAAVIVLVAVALAFAVASSRLFPVQGTSSPAAPVASGPLAVVSASASAPSSRQPRPTPTLAPLPTGPLTPRDAGTVIDVDALVAGVRDGTFDGRLVFVAGTPRTTARSCAGDTTLSVCTDLSIDGLVGPKVAFDPDLGFILPAGWPGDPRPGEVLALIVQGRSLVYLGSLEQAFITAAVSRSALLGDWPSDTTQIRGPFLLRAVPDAALGTRWQVVAIERQAAVLHVTLP